MNFPPAVAASAIPGPTTYGAAELSETEPIVITPRSLVMVISRPSRTALIRGAELTSGPLPACSTGPLVILGSTILDVEGSDP